jgi:hypothetical protein
MARVSFPDKEVSVYLRSGGNILQYRVVAHRGVESRLVRVTIYRTGAEKPPPEWISAQSPFQQLLNIDHAKAVR